MIRSPRFTDRVSRISIEPRAITGTETAADLIDNAFLAYNAGRLREGCQLFVQRMLEPDTTVGLTLTGAMTPAGLGMSSLIPLMELGFVDWVISTGANLYHDAHFALGLAMHRGTVNADDVELREHGVVRIYDIFFDYDVLLETDAFFRRIMEEPPFQTTLSTAALHHLFGKYLAAREDRLGLVDTCVLSTPAPLADYVASFRRFDDLIVGEEVFAIGAPHGYESTVSSGLVSGKRLSTSRRSPGQRLIQSSTPIAPGSSGGGLFDARANLIGITASALPAWPGTFGFAIAVDEFGE